MNRRPFGVITLAIGILTALILLSASVPRIEGAASEWASLGLQQAAERRVLFPQPVVPSAGKRKRIALQGAVLSAERAQMAPPFLPVVEKAAITPRHRLLAEHVLTTLPPHCRTNLKNFFVLYDNARQRGLGGKTTIILDGSVPEEEFLALLVHECAHVTHGNLTGTRSAGESAFTDGHERFFADSPAAAFFAISWETERVLHAGARKEDFVSGYAASDAFEDFAETFAAYVLHRSILQERAKNNVALAGKLAWMETYVPLEENALAVSTFTAGKTIPWDITKLPIAL